MTHPKIVLSEAQKNLLLEFTELFAPHQIVLVGGAVRDALLNRPNDDLDFATSALPTTSEQILRKWGQQFWDPGSEYGTVCASKDGVKVEVTTFRKDTYDPDSRKPEVEFGTDLKDDLLRRDFTVNAFAIGIDETGQPHLYFPDGAIEDLTQKLLATPLDPKVTFSDDPLRMIRAGRFSSQLGFVMEPHTFGAIMESAPQIDKVAPERITAELDKALVGERAHLGMGLLYYTEVLPRLLPGVTIPKWLDKLPPDLESRWAGLLFEQGPARAKELLKGLKHNSMIFNNVPRIIALAGQFLARGYDWDDAQVRKFVWDAGDFLDQAMNIADSVNFDAVEIFAKIYFRLEETEVPGGERLSYHHLKQPLSGDDIKDYLGIPQGKLVGDAIKHLQNLRLENGLISVGEAQRELSLWWKGKA